MRIQLPDFTLDGDTIAPLIFSCFGLCALILSVRLMALRLHPFQRTTDAAFIYVVSTDFLSWILIHYVYREDYNMKTTLGSFLTPAGPYYMAAVFLPQQVLLLFSLCFRGDLAFHALVYTLFLLVSMTFIHTHFSLYAAVNDRFFVENGTKGSFLQQLLPTEARMHCEDEELLPQILLAVCAVMVVTATYRSEKDRVNFLLLSYAGLGFLSWGSCAKDRQLTGFSFLMVEVLSFLLIKLRTFSLSVDNIRLIPGRDSKVKYYRKTLENDIKTVAMVLDGFIGPRGVVCGISRSYEAWIIQMVSQGIDVVLFSAFPKEEIEQYFEEKIKDIPYYVSDSDSLSSTSSEAKGDEVFNDNEKKKGKVIAFKIDALDIKYVSQIYYATRCNWRNVKTVSTAFHKLKPDVVHVVFDGTSGPIFSWACALLRIPIVGIMHTDSIVICERNGFKFLAPMILMAQKMSGAGLESIATRSESFAHEMLQLRNWKVDHVIKPHVRTEIFKPIKNDPVLEIRKKLTFSKPNEEVTYDENTKKFSDGKFLMIYAGRFDVDKRVDELIEIIKCLKDDENIYLAMIGGGSLAEDIQEIHGNDMKVYCHSEFLSHEELALYYNAADIHISASQMETLGNTVLESMACGTPVLVPRAQGFVDTVRDGEAGVLWDTHKDLAAVEIIRKMASNDAYLLKLKNGAMDSVGSLSCSSAVKDLILWYVEAAEHRRLKTLFIARILMSTFLLVLFFMFDLLVFQHAKAVLQSFSDKKVREKNRKELLKSAQ